MTRLSALFAVILIGLGSLGTWIYLTALEPPAPDIVCWEMPQSDLRGWKRIPEWDRQRISDKISRGKASFREEWSLKCRQYQEGDIGEIMVREQWYRSK